MEKIKKAENIVIVHIISEPGDGTQYDYGYLKQGYDFCFIPIGNAFRYPQRLNYFSIKDINANTREIKKVPNKVKKIAEQNNCNICTVLECIRTMQEVMNAVYSKAENVIPEQGD